MEETTEKTRRPAQGLKLMCRNEGQRLIIFARGNIGQDMERQKIVEYINQRILFMTEKVIALDVSDCHGSHPAFSGVLVYCTDMLRKCGRDMEILNPQKELKEMLLDFGLESMLNIRQTYDTPGDEIFTTKVRKIQQKTD
jgi:anti-anti-sigma regulatory factor